jgi:hypothetical protein
MLAICVLGVHPLPVQRNSWYAVTRTLSFEGDQFNVIDDDDVADAP